MYNMTTQHALKEIANLEDFEELLETSTLTDLDKTIFKLHYLQEKDFAFIADSLGYSESGIRKRHIKALRKLSTLL